MSITVTTSTLVHGGRCWWDFTAARWVCGPRCDLRAHPEPASPYRARHAVIDGQTGAVAGALEDHRSHAAAA
ncbi:MAG: hypothetical protein M3140_04840 [Actinomycetota bacterium]|nr:hypothetical protein [Actinomycetota bacterium]